MEVGGRKERINVWRVVGGYIGGGPCVKGVGGVHRGRKVCVVKVGKGQGV